MKTKKVLHISLFALLSILCLSAAVLLNTNQAQAKRMINKAKYLKEDKVYKLDLNGDGKKDKVKYKATENYDKGYSRVKVFVNGKKFYQKKLDGFSANVVVCDLYAKQKGMNLFVYATADSDCFTTGWFLKCNSKKAKVISKFKNGLYDKLELYRFGGKFQQTKEDGCFNLYADTPFYITAFGCGIYKVPCRLSQGKVKLIDAKTYKCTFKYTYKLKRAMTLYKKADTSSTSFTAAAGTKLTQLAIMPVTYNNAEDHYNVGFVKVKLANGTVGWYYASEEDNKACFELPYFLEIPAWG